MSKCIKKIVIIGASSEMGFRLANSLDDNYNVFCVVRSLQKKHFLKYNIKVVQIDDISLFEKYSIVFENAFAIINCSYIFFC